MSEERFAQIVARYRDAPNVTLGTGFGTNPGLRVGGKIFAMLAHEHLVVKLPRPRVDELVDAGTGARFQPGTGRVMKEWLSVPADAAGLWDTLVDEAFRFVGGDQKAIDL